MAVKGFRIDPFKRYQRAMGVVHLYPIRNDGLCACGCGQKLTGRKRRWATPECQKKAVGHFLVVKGDTREIRKQLFEAQGGVCQNCGVDCGHLGVNGPWDADHIKPVHKGGGACGIENFQTLCKTCHKSKTANGSKQFKGKGSKGSQLDLL